MRLNFINIWGNYISRLIPGELFYPLPTGKVSENIYTICDRGDANFFIYTDGKDTICFDVGYINNNYVKKDFKQIGINPKSISHVFLTHTDMDHAGAIDSDSSSNWLNNDLIIYMSKEEENLIKKRKRRRFFFNTPIRISKQYNFIEDGGIVNVGNIKIKAIHTPGHTLGHMSYLINNKYLFAGDLLLLKNGKAEEFYKVWNIDHDLDKESIKKIAKLENIEILCTCHSKCSFDFKRAMEEWNK
ncbi:MAG: MBL fold metallo-hydrolase [Bacteroidales bacterium]|jgi:glyoxylase-like metal-dependent hydrolase (beta-lactamase superfamily II)|nr:MBL fold metallo-hydrolase [Bacteroidales bacterium]